MFNREEKALEVVWLTWVSAQDQDRFSLLPFRKKVVKLEQTQRKAGTVRDPENVVYGPCSWGSRKTGWRCESRASMILENSVKRRGIKFSLCLHELSLQERRIKLPIRKHFNSKVA